MDEALEGSIYLDGIITVIDAKYYLKVRPFQSFLQTHLENLEECEISSTHHSDDINEAQRQAAFADVIIINKVCIRTRRIVRIFLFLSHS